MGMNKYGTDLDTTRASGLAYVKARIRELEATDEKTAAATQELERLKREEADLTASASQ
jgi:hypothetical protein